MAPRKPKITLAEVQAWCNANGYWLIERPLVMVGTIQTQIYKETTGRLVIVTNQIEAKGVMVAAEED